MSVEGSDSARPMRPFRPERLIMPWATFVGLLDEGERTERVKACRKAWGGLPPAVVVEGESVEPMWDDEGGS